MTHTMTQSFTILLSLSEEGQPIRPIPTLTRRSTITEYADRLTGREADKAECVMTGLIRQLFRVKRSTSQTITIQKIIMIIRLNRATCPINGT